MDLHHHRVKEYGTDGASVLVPPFRRSRLTVLPQFWLHIPVERANGPTAVECIVEKKTMINLVQAFSVACKVSGNISIPHHFFFTEVFGII